MPDSVDVSLGKSKAERRRNSIRAAAAELFSEKTYLDTTMEEIAAAAGVSKGGMYYHYRKKSEVLFDIQCQVLEDLLTGLEDALAPAESARDKLRVLIERQLRYYADHLPQVRTLLNDRHCLDPDQLEIVSDLNMRYLAIVRGHVVDAIGRDDPAVVNPIAFGLFGLCNWIPGWFREGGPSSIEQLAVNTAKLFLEGLDGFSNDGNGG